MQHAYEAAIAASIRTRHAVAFSFGRTALTAILSAFGLKPGDEIVLSPLTCQVVPLALLSLGLRPVYSDIDPTTLNLDAKKAEQVLTRSTRAILFQRTYGISSGTQAMAALANARGLRLIEDCAQCFPLATDTQSFGLSGSAAIFSHNLRKPLPAGSGGIAATNDDLLAQAIYRLRNALPHEGFKATLALRTEVFLHKRVLRPSNYWFLYDLSRRFQSGTATDVTGAARRPSPYRMREGLTWMRRLNDVVRHSQDCCEDYAESLRDCSDSFVQAAVQNKFLYYFPVRVARKQDLLRQARKQNIELIAWPISTPIFPLQDPAQLTHLGYKMGMCPEADVVASQLVGLPTELGITKRHRANIVALVRNFLTT